MVARAWALHRLACGICYQTKHGRAATYPNEQTMVRLSRPPTKDIRTGAGVMKNGWRPSVPVGPRTCSRMARQRRPVPASSGNHITSVVLSSLVLRLRRDPAASACKHGAARTQTGHSTISRP
ncbi:hypothetical protein MAPG_04367 [Magnaporthiopsis poae ATCC 64411]|uniref:Uncharacterized protein n=1 Tax=Magnaporthiopsis poae (strain ATCC 64411 / 73-15) TaxID=644358 RepID=A0A0C4DWI6_MAGP6|nr:hypothetical protein MAPG_04367 [Magnaporthiopsis poae ATCC 64411]